MGLLPSLLSWPRRLLAAQAWKSRWMATVCRRWKARSAAGATLNPSATMRCHQTAKIPDERRAATGISSADRTHAVHA